jgi:hypothetical protein
VNATFTLAGTILGDLVGVDANLFLRPDAHITGEVDNIAGGLYPSALAHTGAVVDHPLAPYRVRRKGSAIIIEGQREVAHIKLDGFNGFHAPTYDRVDALFLSWGASYLTAPEDEPRTRLHGWGGYASGRGALEGGAELARLRDRSVLALGALQEKATNDRWLRNDIDNSLSFLTEGKDYRNYYLATRYYARAGRTFGGETRGVDLSLWALRQKDRSLGAGDQWTWSDEPVRPNPPIDSGVIASLGLGADGRWVGRHAAWWGWGGLEFAGKVLGGDFAFNRYVLYGNWLMDALANHALQTRWYFQGPLFGTRSLPRQRWSVIGGSGTLPTFEPAQFTGDRVVFVDNYYIIPLPKKLSIGPLGPPELDLIYAIGMAWSADTTRRLEQNLGFQIVFLIPYIRVMTNPGGPRELDVDVGLLWPFRRKYPWRTGR